MKMSTFQGSRERDIDWKVGREDSYLGEREGRGRRREKGTSGWQGNGGMRIRIFPLEWKQHIPLALSLGPSLRCTYGSIEIGSKDIYQG